LGAASAVRRQRTTIVLHGGALDQYAWRVLLTRYARSGKVRTGTFEEVDNIKRQWDPQKLFSQSAIDSVTLVEKITYG